MANYLLTNELVTELKCPIGRTHYEAFDSIVKGLFLDVLKNGLVRYRIRYWLNYKKCLKTLGDARLMDISQARLAAMNVKAEVKLLRLQGLSTAETVRNTAPSALTVQDFFESKYLPYVRTYKRSYRSDESMIRSHIAPSMGHCELAKVTSSLVLELIQAMQLKKLAPGTINRALVLLRYAFKLASRWKIPNVNAEIWNDINLIKHDNRIERYLTLEQSMQLLKAVRESNNSKLHHIVAFLIYTGARKREVLDAQWSDINWEQRSWKISKNKSSKIRHVPLSEGAMDVLMAIQKETNFSQTSTFIFANPQTGKPYTSFFYSWDAARKKAGMPELRVHDLRHSFASFLVNAGRSLYEVQELLGHADMKTTSRYAHLSRERLVAAVACVPRL